MSTNLLILLMTCITFSCRYLFFMNTLPIRLSPKIQQLLQYTAPSVLTAMWSPIVFLSHKHNELSLVESPYLYAGLITIIASLIVKNTLSVVLLGIGSFLFLNWVL